MAISLQDAVERAKLSNDNEGCLSQYMYGQLLSSLDQTDQHAFAMALVDSGVKVKTGVERTRMALESVSEVDPSADKGSFGSKEIFALFKRQAQQFLQSPGGLWVPSDYVNQPKVDQQEEEKPDYSEMMKNVEDFDEEGSDYLDKKKKWVTPEQSEAEFVDESPSDFLDIDTMEYVRDVLEKNGISVDSRGMVSYYSSGVPGIFKDRKSPKSMPLDKAVQSNQQQLDMAVSEQKKVGELQDILTRFKNDSEALSKFQYSPSSKNPMIGQIGEGLVQLRGKVDNMGELTNSMVGLLDQYNQGQYDKYESLMEVNDALFNLQQWKSVDPQKFKTVVEGIGAV